MCKLVVKGHIDENSGMRKLMIAATNQSHGKRKVPDLNEGVQKKSKKVRLEVAQAEKRMKLHFLSTIKMILQKRLFGTQKNSQMKSTQL